MPLLKILSAEKETSESNMKDYKKILEIIAKAALKSQTVEIYYPATENSKAGWREVEPYSLALDIGEGAEHLVYGEDRISPGHIFNGYTIGSEDNHCDSFIIGKIQDSRPTKKKFTPRNNWKVEF